MPNARFQFTIWHLIKLVILCAVVAAILRSECDLLSMTVCAAAAAAIAYELKTRNSPHASNAIRVWLHCIGIAVVYGLPLYTTPGHSTFRTVAPALLIASVPDSFWRLLSRSARRLIYSLDPMHLIDESSAPVGLRGCGEVTVDERSDR
jgi:hypothetical protein